MRRPCLKRLPVLAVACALLVFAGCAGKAHTLKVGATQFESSSLTAIDSIDNLMKAEIAAPPRSEAEASQEFVDLILGSKSELTEDHIKLALDPNSVDLSSDVVVRREKLLSTLRSHYTTFARIFDRIEEGSFFASDKVSKAKVPAEKLTAQLVYFAHSITNNPPQFTQRRSNLMLEIKVLHGDQIQGLSEDKKRRLLAPYGLPPDREITEADKRRALALWRERWLALLKEEDTLMSETVAQCLKASIIGVSIQKHIDAYNKLSLQDISEGISFALTTAGALTGEDFSDLQVKTNDLINTINNDPAWKTAVDEALSLLNNLKATGETDSAPQSSAAPETETP